MCGLTFFRFAGVYVLAMEDSQPEVSEFSELSDKEVEELAERFVEEVPAAFGEALGVDVFADLEEEERREAEEEMYTGFERLISGLRDAMSKDSEEERIVAMSGVYSQLVDDFVDDSVSCEEVDGGPEFIVEIVGSAMEASREGMDDLGYVEYFDLMEDFAVEILEEGLAGQVEDFYDGLDAGSQQILLQRVMNPVLMDYFEYLSDHPEITDADEARRYTEIYYELAELVTNLLPQFIAVVQIVDQREEEYDRLAQMGLNDLLQKLEGKKYARFNELAEAIDREVRNSIAHREYKIKPVEQEIEFYDRGNLVAELSYPEFEEEVRQLLALFNALWVFRVILTYYRIKALPEIIDELQQKQEKDS